MPTYTQDNRFLQLETPLGPDLLVTDLHGVEEMSRLFRYEMTLISDRDDVTASDLVGSNVSVSWHRDGGPSWVNAYVSEFTRTTVGESPGYRAVLVPWLWFLGQRSSCRIFQQKSIVDIVEAVFSDAGFSDFEMRLGSYPPREYVVQYNETDLEFVSRLLEEAGIFYFFTHAQGKHTLVLADATSAYLDADESEVPFHTELADTDHITSWERSSRFRTGKVALSDYDFLKPTNSLMASVNTVVELPDVGKHERYEYPGAYLTSSAGKDVAKTRIEAIEAAVEVTTGDSSCRSFAVGHKFTLSRHDQMPPEEGLSYVITSIRHAVSDHSYAGGDQDYRNSFTCIPSTTVFRPERITPAPRVAGLQSARVVGPSGEEIYVDEHGRIKVQFHWDREGKKNEDSSCWIRVAQTSAGGGFGAVFIPRIGHEVIVDFLDGDVDRPIVIGTLYNGDNKPPYKLPDNKTVSTIKTNSSKGGGGFNEIRFEDKKDSEELFFHAQKDQTIVVENDRNESTGHDRSLEVGNDKSESVGRNKSIEVGKNHQETIGADASIEVGGSRTESIGKDQTETIGGGLTVSVGKGGSLSIGKGYTVSVSDAQSVSVGKNASLSIGKDSSTDVGGKSSTSVGKEYTLEAKAVEIKASDSITLKAGSAVLELKKNGDITLKGKNINVKGSGKVVVKGQQIGMN